MALAKLIINLEEVPWYEVGYINGKIMPWIGQNPSIICNFGKPYLISTRNRSSNIEILV